jgi:hypothetical protein
MKIGTQKKEQGKNIKDRLVDHDLVGVDGGRALEIDNPIDQLIHIIGGGFFNEPRYYDSRTEGKDDYGLTKSSQDIVNAINEAVAFSVQNQSPEDVLIIANWVRNGLNIRTTADVMLAVAAHELPVPHRSFVKLYAPAILTRADDPVEAFGVYRHFYQKTKGNLHEGTVPNALRDGLVAAIQKQSNVQLMKYFNNKTRPNLKDLLIMVRKDKFNHRNAVSKGLFEYIVNGKVDETDEYTKTHSEFYKQTEFTTASLDQAKMLGLTWENILSHFGSKKEVWEALLGRNMIGYMAMLRNLRNFEQAGISQEYWDKIAKKLIETPADKHKQLPFRFYSAYVNVSTTKSKDAAALALENALGNIPQLGGNTFIFADNSGSMEQRVSEKSERTCQEVANLLCAIFAKSQKGQVWAGSFGGTFEEYVYSKTQSVIDIMQGIQSLHTGHATNMSTALEWLLQKGHKVDRIIVLSDMNSYSEAFMWGGRATESPAVLTQRYIRQVNPNCHVYSVNLAASRQAQVDPLDNHVHLISGWSESIFTMIGNIEGKIESTGDRKKATIPTIEVLRETYRVR